MGPFAAELLGTALLVFLGNGAVANVVLNRTKGESSGWIVITAGWGLAVFVSVLCVATASGAHINPAVTLGMALAGTFRWESVPAYVAAQMLGAFCGATLVWLHYRPHFSLTDDADAKLSAFCTAPAVRDLPANLISETLATAVLVLAVLLMAKPSASLGALDALPVGLVVFAIGLSLGGTTGYAINPARDLGPRIAHWLLPVHRKRDSDWSYAWIPVVGPMLGAVLAAMVFRNL
jgi:glycerol uptake facilitator protein